MSAIDRAMAPNGKRIRIVRYLCTVSKLLAGLMPTRAPIKKVSRKMRAATVKRLMGQFIFSDFLNFKKKKRTIEIQMKFCKAMEATAVKAKANRA